MGVMSNGEIYEDAIKTFGPKHQIIKAIEELSELVTALARYSLGEGNLDNIAEEIADVEVMCEQLIMIFKNLRLVLEIKEQKTERLRRTLVTVKVNRLTGGAK